VGTTRAIGVWKRLFHTTGFNCTAIEAHTPISNARIVGFCSSVFVNTRFVNEEIARPRPQVNARIVESVNSGKSIVLTESELRSGNTKEGLDLVVLCSCWRRDLLKGERISEAQMLLASSFAQAHVGYRLSRLLWETIGEAEREFAAASHTWRHVSNFRSFNNCSYAERSLWLVTRTDALAVPWSITAMLFHYREPVLRLHPADQQILIAALDGLTDQELSNRLGLNLGTVKKRWLSLFDRVADARPELLLEVEDEKGDHKRGRQKRHHVLAYVRGHPEELRPIEIRFGRKVEYDGGPDDRRAGQQFNNSVRL
jgi:DNA-binding CsgD family transcriptional regulator